MILGVQFNLTEEETETLLSQPLSLTAVDDESNTDNNNQQIVIGNGELFSFTEESAQNEDLEEVIYTSIHYLSSHSYILIN